MHGEGEGACMVVGVCMVKGACVAGHACMAEVGVHGGGGHVWWGGIHGRRDGHCSGQYASY